MSTQAYNRRKDPTATNPGFGKRLREERERLGLSQEAFGEIGGIRRAAQYLYEQGSRVPSMEYIIRVVAAGADLSYLVIGKRGHGSDSWWALEKDALFSVYQLVLEFARDSKGRLLDVEHQLALLNSLCDAVSDKASTEIDWNTLRQELATAKTKSS